MHGQLTTFIVGENSREQVEQAIAGLRDVVKGQDGFSSITFFFDERTHEFLSTSLWDSKEAADAGGKALTKAVQGALGDDLKDQVVNRTVDVLDA